MRTLLQRRNVKHAIGRQSRVIAKYRNWRLETREKRFSRDVFYSSAKKARESRLDEGGRRRRRRRDEEEEEDEEEEGKGKRKRR